MVAVKGRLKPHSNQPTKNHKMNNSGEVNNSKSFKVYTEAEKEKVCHSINSETKGELFPPKSGNYLLSAGGLKSGNGRLATSKSKLVKPVKIKDVRKVLADISNVKGGFSKSEQGKNSRTEKSKIERMLYPQRDTGGQGKKKPISSEQPLRISEESEALKLPVKQGKVGSDLIEVATRNQTFKKSANENIKATSYEQRSKFQNRGSITATVRTSARIPIHLTRKSLPTYKQVSPKGTSGSTKKSQEKSEKSKGKHGFPVKSGVRRSTITKPSILTKPPWGSRVSDGFLMIDTGVRGKKKPISSEQPLRISEESDALKLPIKQGKLRSNLIEVAARNRTFKKSANENIKATSYEQRSKFQNWLITATVRTSARIPHLTRKSLPIYKQVSLKGTSGYTKKSQEKSEKSKGKHGFPVKSGVRRSTIPKPSILTKPPWGSRVSDGNLMMASRTLTKVDARVVLRKSVKTNPKSKSVLTINRLKSGSVASSNKKQENDSLSKDILSSHEERVSMEDLSGRTSDSDRTANVIATKKSDRRNSYTRLLMSGSKDALPKIYDDRNHLEVTEYIDDIYQYYWVMEGQNPLLKNYMEIQKEITPQMRGILINWLIEVHMKFDLMEETLFLTVLLLDRYLSLEIIKKNEMQLVGLTSLLLASKYEDFWHPRVADLISISAETYTRDQMLKMEEEMLRKLKFRLNEPTLYVFMLRFIKAAQADAKLKNLAFYLIEICLVEYEVLNYKPSMLCASAIYLARCTMGITPPWTPLLAKHARYEESQIRECAKMILKFHKASKTTLLKVTCDKYGKLGYGRAANIKPLDILPL